MRISNLAFSSWGCVCVAATRSKVTATKEGSAIVWLLILSFRLPQMVCLAKAPAKFHLFKHSTKLKQTGEEKKNGVEALRIEVDILQEAPLVRSN